MRLMQMVVCAGVAMVLSGCVSSRMSTIPTSTSPMVIRVIALSPGGGILADAVGGEMANRGFQIVDPGSTARIIGRVNLSEFEVTRPDNILKLRDQGVDAVLSVHAAGGYDLQPQSASARITSTTTGQLISAVTWQNGWGGMQGSIADRSMRSGLAEAAAEIANGIAANIRQDRSAPLQTIAIAPAPTASAAGQDVARGDNKYGYTAEKFAQEQRCVARTSPVLVASGPGFETFSVACTVGEPLLVRCDYGQCRSLK